MKPQEWQTLSAYIDNQLSAKKKAAVEKRLETEPEFQKAFKELVETRALLHRMPRQRIPHNFTLSPEMVLASSHRAPRLFPVFSFSSALASVLLVVSIVFQWGIGSAPSAMKGAMESADAVTAFEEHTQEGAPQIILWGEPDYSGGAVEGRGGNQGGSEPGMLMESAPGDNNLFSEEMPAEEAVPAPALQMPELPDAEKTEAMPATPLLEDDGPAMMKAAPEEAAMEITGGEGPILGIPSTEDEGQIRTSPANENLSAPARAESAQPQLPILQMVLAAVAAASGITAVILRRKSLT